ncbi:MAG: hypothetical protein ACTSXL_05515 [Alphaproteobacteria bacterium]|nr:MAG: hypothetical protein B6I23_00520 [Rickettsiaceae bacterium 4572_127]
MTNKTTKWILAISILTNIFFIGMFGGKLIYKRGPHFRMLEKILPKNDLKEHRFEIRKKRRYLRKVLSETPLNKEKVSKAFYNLEKTRQLFHKKMQQHLSRIR